MYMYCIRIYMSKYFTKGGRVAQPHLFAELFVQAVVDDVGEHTEAAREAEAVAPECQQAAYM
jgi:hypothetical protein